MPKKVEMGVDAQRERIKADIDRLQRRLEHVDEADAAWRTRTKPERHKLLEKQRITWGLREVRWALTGERSVAKAEAKNVLAYKVFKLIYDKWTAKGRPSDGVPISREELTGKVDTSRRHLSRVLNELESKHGFIIRHNMPGFEAAFDVVIPDSDRYEDQLIYVQGLDAEDDARLAADERG